MAKRALTKIMNEGNRRESARRVEETLTRVKPFKGGDWTELSERWGIDLEQDGDEVLEQTVKYMGTALGDKAQRGRVVKDIRAFLKKLASTSKGVDYSWPVWEGLLNIPMRDKAAGEETLIQFTRELLGCMWN